MKLSFILSLLPDSLVDELCRILRSRRDGGDLISEIRLRQDGPCSVRIGNENIRLFVRLGRGEIEKTLEKISGGALYAHRDSIADGYISLSYGIRVGIAGRASYDGGRLVGVSEIRSLIFRIPTGRCAFPMKYTIFFLVASAQGCSFIHRRAWERLRLCARLPGRSGRVVCTL